VLALGEAVLALLRVRRRRLDDTLRGTLRTGAKPRRRALLDRLTWTGWDAALPPRQTSSSGN